MALVLLIAGLRRRPAAIRRRARIGLAATGGFAALAVGGLAVAGAGARPDITNAANLSEQAISTLNSGDYQTAAEQFADASQAFARADDRLNGPVALPSRLIPGVAQNVRAGAQLAAEASAGTAAAADALDSIDPATLTVVDGAIDLAAVAAVEAPLVDVQDALDALRGVSASVTSPWLAAPLQDELDELDRRLDDNEPRLQNAIDAVRLAPQMLGGDSQRRYLVMFTTPVEARGITGFMGNYAEVTVTNGAIELTDFGRTAKLNQAARDNRARCDGCPPEAVTRYDRWAFGNGDGGEVGRAAWSDLTIAAHFPYTARAAQILYPQSNGTPIDGVIAMDPYVVQALMQYTGPITLDGVDVTVQPDQAAQFILQDQYELIDDASNTARIEALDSLGQQAIAALLSSALPVPSDLARDLGPLVEEHRLVVWTDDPTEEEFLERVGMTGALPALGDDGGFAVMVSNGGNSKIDVYLERTVDVAIENRDDGQRVLVADVTLTNNAPASGLPRYVIGNNFGFPSGTSWLWVNFFGPDGLIAATRNGEPMELDQGVEVGWQTYELYDTMQSGASVTYRLEFELGPSTDGVDEPVRWTQPLARRMP